jgi:hypothetical protein
VDVAVTFTCDVPATALLPAVKNTRTPELAVVKAAVTPAGSAEADSVTLAANPLRGVKETALVPLPPWITCKAAGASAMAKSGGGVTVTVIVTADVRLPEVPLTVNVDTLFAAALVAVSVSVLVAVVLAGLNAAVTPVGKPVAVKATAALKPACGPTVMVAIPVPPAATFTLRTEEESLKLGAAATVRAMVACAERGPDVPVTVKVDKPTTVEAAAVSFKVVPVNTAVTPVGNPATARVAIPVKPFRGVTVMVFVPDAPCITLTLAGAAARVKLGPAFTVRLSVTEEVDAP